MTRKIIAIALLLCGYISQYKAQYQVLTNLSDSLLGSTPMGSLIKINNQLIGTASAGGQNQVGSIYSISLGQNQINLNQNWQYNFGSQFGSIDGSGPSGKLLKLGNLYYGLTNSGGKYGQGTIYSTDLKQSYKILYHFGALNNDGGNPNGSLIAVGSKLYGTASTGGANGDGAIFSLDTTNFQYALIYNFDGTNGASTPNGSLTYSGYQLYGTTAGVSGTSFGNVFSIHLDGSNYTNLYSFGNNADGGTPNGSLSIINHQLFGLTSTGGNFKVNNVIQSNGTLFRIDTLGNNFTTLVEFQGQNGPNNTASNPNGSLLFSNDTLYGVTSYGGINGAGNVFSILPDGSNYKDLYSFNGNDGTNPESDLMRVGNQLLGTTIQGGGNGNSNAAGNLFSVQTNGTWFKELAYFTNSNYPNPGSSPSGPLIYDNNLIIGTTSTGGANSHGILFTLNPNDTIIKVIHTFGKTNFAPNADLIPSKDKALLYGMTPYGGPYGSEGSGIIYSIDTLGNNFKILYNFEGKPDGANPMGNLTLSLDGSKLFGLTSNGGTGTTSPQTAGTGTIFEINTDGTGYEKIIDFPNNLPASYGSQPTGTLLLSKDGSQLYGLTVGGGTKGLGNIFSISTDQNHTYKDMYDFASNYSEPRPKGTLTASITGDTLYGMTTSGGANGSGSIFSYTLHNNSYSSLLDFDANGIMGRYPYGSLTLSNDGQFFYGTTFYGGPNGLGNIFSMRIKDKAFQVLHYCDSTSGYQPNGSLLQIDSNLYGTMSSGGKNGIGVIFKYKLNQNTSIGATTVWLCPGETYKYKDSLLSSGGSFADTIKNGAINGKDSIHILNLMYYQLPQSLSVVTICQGESYNFNGNLYNTAGYHTDTLKNASINGCDSIAVLSLKFKALPSPVINQNGPNGLLTTTSFTSYQWYVNGNKIPNDTIRAITIYNTGYYQVKVKGADGCSDTSATFYYKNTGIQNINKASVISIYPNPNQGLLSVNISNITEDCTLQLFDELGNLTLVKKLIGESTNNINLSSFKNGIYLWKVYSNSSLMEFGKIVLNR